MDYNEIRVFLASGSPRRKELLEKAGIHFEVLVTDVNEETDGYLSPYDFVSVVSRRKAEAAVSGIRNGANNKKSAVIAADTIVCINGAILGKPKNFDDAFMMLRLLGGNWHDVYTGITIAFIDGKQAEYIQDCCVTKVKFKPLSDDQIIRYINTGEPFDKAGAYAIQGKGGNLIEKTDGDYNNVVGLPLERTLEILNKKTGGV